MRHILFAAGITLCLLVGTAALIFAAVLLPAEKVRAADMPRTVVIAPPVVLQREANLCTIAAASGMVEVYEEPRGEVWGFLPAGMIVEVMDWPFSDVTDLWVRIKPPRREHYYGWVATDSFVCH
ncbi:MAG: hypothetical protein AAFW98_07410 [Pseudomonadota bacterium]